jgi:hypothetical protein
VHPVIPVAGLDPAIHVSVIEDGGRQSVDARIKSGQGVKGLILQRPETVTL